MQEDPLKLDLSRWDRVELEDGDVAFERGPGDHLIAFSFDQPPDIPVPLREIDRLRDFYRAQITAAGGGLVSADVVSVDGLPAVETIFKFPQESSGMTYLASLTLPFRDMSFVLKLQCQELGTTGGRDAAVMMMPGEVDLDADDWQTTWAQDPYDPDHRAPVLRNRSDDPKWDATFPDHPLSRARRYLRELRDSTKVSPELRASAPFEG